MKCHHHKEDADGRDGNTAQPKQEPLILISTFTLPSTYPAAAPEISISSSSLSRSVCQRLRQGLLEHANSLPPDEPMILELVEWLKEHGPDYMTEMKNYVDEANSNAAVSEEGKQISNLYCLLLKGI